MNHGAGGNSLPQGLKGVLGDLHQGLKVTMIEMVQEVSSCLFNVLTLLALPFGGQIGFRRDGPRPAAACPTTRTCWTAIALSLIYNTWSSVYTVYIIGEKIHSNLC